MNNLPFELFVAVRYLLARRKQAFISLISLISTLGVMVGVMALLIALALMTGLQGELRDRIVHLVVRGQLAQYEPAGVPLHLVAEGALDLQHAARRGAQRAVDHGRD